jgi:hypothetical protein
MLLLYLSHAQHRDAQAERTLREMDAGLLPSNVP